MIHPPPRVDGPVYARGAGLATLGAPLTSPRERVRLALRHPVLTGRYAHLIATLPSLHLPLSDEPAGQYLRNQLGDSWRRTSSHVVLPLPATLADYLRGRSRQAVRTNLSHARALGLTAARVPPDRTAAAVVSYDKQADFHGESSRLHDTDAAAFTRWWAVTDRLGHTLAIGLVAQDCETALLRVLIGPKDRSVAHQSRYLLHTAMVEDLIGDGVRYLVVEAVLGAPAGHKYFAARLGYQPFRVRLTAGARLAAAARLAAPARECVAARRTTPRNVPVPLDWS